MIPGETLPLRESFPLRDPRYPTSEIDTGHKALCPVSRYVDRAYLWAPALGTGHTCGSRRFGCIAFPKRFFNTCVQLANDDRDIDLYHWSSARFSAAWIDTISVLLAKGRARVGVADAATDWPRRIRDMQYLDHESLEAGA